MNKKIKISIVDDHTLFREGLKLVLSQIEDFHIINDAESGTEFLKLLKTLKPDIVLMDISMPDMDGVQATEKALRLYPDIKILALSSYSDHVYYYKMIIAGVQGFVIKKSGKKELEKAIREVYRGGNHFPQDILRKLIFKIGTTGANSAFSNQIELSKRETEVLKLICNGNTTAEIAEQLHISTKTVDNHRTNLLEKTSTKNSAHLVMFAIKNHLIDL